MDARIVLRETKNVKNQPLQTFPIIFSVGNFLDQKCTFYMPMWGQFVLSTTLINIMACCPIFWCNFCFLTIHSTAFCQLLLMSVHKSPQSVKKALDNFYEACIKAFMCRFLCILKLTYYNHHYCHCHSCRCCGYGMWTQASRGISAEHI